MAAPPGPGPWAAYRLRWKRRRLLWRSFRKRRELAAAVDRTGAIRPGALLCFATVRNEALRLPYWLDYHRRLGVAHFLIVTHDCSDGTRALLDAAPDVSVWTTTARYRAARFGTDWLNWLLARYGCSHWCLTLDADELFVYPHCDSRDLAALTAFLAARGQVAMGATMLDLYPAGRLESGSYAPGEDPLKVLTHFDAWGHVVERQLPMENLWLRGGPRARVFFADRPLRAPTLNKVPLVRWRRGYAYLNSTHSALPRILNRVHDAPGHSATTGALLHTKFLPGIAARSAEEKRRGEHFGRPGEYDAYYDRLIADPLLWSSDSVRYRGWRQLEDLALISRGAWV